MPWRIPLRLSARVLAFFLSDPRLFVRYISVGGIAAGIEFGLFSVFYQAAGWPLLAANCLALAVAIATSFVLQKNWTFKARGEASRQFHLYLWMQAVSVVLNNLLIWLFIAQWQWYAPLAKILEIGIVFLWNFGFCKLVVFRRAKSDPLAASARTT